jgi:hypothetical protein
VAVLTQQHLAELREVQDEALAAQVRSRASHFRYCVRPVLGSWRLCGLRGRLAACVTVGCRVRSSRGPCWSRVAVVAC